MGNCSGGSGRGGGSGGGSAVLKQNVGDVALNIKLPKIEGSEAQVKYAQDLLKKAMLSEAETWQRRYEDASKERQKELVESGIASVNKRGGNAKNWSDVVNYMVMNQSVKKHFQGAYQFAKNNPSAKEIIEKYKDWY